MPNTTIAGTFNGYATTEYTTTTIDYGINVSSCGQGQWIFYPDGVVRWRSFIAEELINDDGTLIEEVT